MYVCWGPGITKKSESKCCRKESQGGYRVPGTPTLDDEGLKEGDRRGGGGKRGKVTRLRACGGGGSAVI